MFQIEFVALDLFYDLAPQGDSRSIGKNSAYSDELNRYDESNYRNAYAKYC